MKPNEKNSRNLFYLALLLTLVFNGATFFFTFEHTYDSFVHIFFADHYANAWFDNWEYRWYTGFNITSYPPLVHQIVALLSKIVGLKLGFYMWAVFVQLVFVRGVYHFSQILVDHRSAGIAAILAVLSSSMVEALHIFGQVPSITGVSFLLNACPEIYNWFRYKKPRYLIMGLSFLAVTTAAHHVTTIFGMVFFILPIIGLAVIDNSYELEKGVIHLRLTTFLKNVFKVLPKAIFFGISVIAICVIVVFPYWYWSKTDPINQISIPHGSRSSFIAETDMGLVFFLIPWGVLLLFLSYFFARSWERRYTFIGLSITLAFVLGTGGTTPIPIKLLGETAFNILTLDRFTFWGSVLTLPFWGLLVNELLTGSYRQFLLKTIGNFGYKLVLAFLALSIIIGNILIVNMNTLRPFQPTCVQIEPIVQFLERDQHDEWRYLALGFGDQMAWLSANTNALTVDGNYHSARRLPEMTTRAVERLENSKYKGEEGLGALRDFLVNADKFNLKYIFNNDKFYEPILYFAGWYKVQVMSNNIAIWEKPDIAPLPSILPRKNIPEIQRLMWGILPLSCFGLMVLFFIIFKIWKPRNKIVAGEEVIEIPKLTASVNNKINWWFHSLFAILVMLSLGIFIGKGYFNQLKQNTPKKTILSYYNALDFRYFKEAHAYINAADNLDFNQFVMERSIEDGILASYAKLSDIFSEIDRINETQASAKVTANWVTSLGTYVTNEEHQLVKVGKKWFLQAEKKSIDIPADQYITTAELALHNQGRRLADVNKTRHEDILDRPMVNVIEANLVKKDSTFAIVGTIQNLDNVPAYISLEGKIYDEKNNLLAKNNVNDVRKHTIYPKEITPFRIDLLYKQKSDSIQIKNFVLQVKSLVSSEPTYKFVGLQNIQTNEENITCEFINFGTQEAAIPQVLVAQRNADKKLFWVDKTYLKEGVRSRRKKDVNIHITHENEVEIVMQASRKQIVINGEILPQTTNLGQTMLQEIELFTNCFVNKK